MNGRPCPVFLVHVTQERDAEFYVAAETEDEARQVGEQVARREMSGWPDSSFYQASAVSAAGISDRHVHESGGVFVAGLNGAGDWVERLDDVPRLPPKPDPNQLTLDISVKPTPHMESVEMKGETL